MEDIKSLLLQCPVLAGLPVEGINEAVQIVRARDFDEKALICSKGAQHSSLMVIAKGSVRVNSISSKGKEVTLMIFEAGGWFGDNVFSPGMPRIFGATAHTDVTLLELPGDKFRQLLAKYPQSYPVILDLLSRRLWSAISVIEDDAIRGIEERIGRRLLLLAEYQHNRPISAQSCVVKVTREHIANMMGLTRQSVHKVLKKLENSNVLRLQYGSITILNPLKMEAYLKQLE
ncbi:Crp/Fnr family transcriptional regulator [Vibrio parahaemolyticus]|nr:Crp/Fnr family transcriptional regulator [Vibrio parahaemolyticus]EIC2572656.1 Crp/Fnr family transcriptional regulator [Vibrio parahaemolyticus]EID0037462.1 Crp/Fnr family transcriptional regulator [Vibrio parahaemolyticus]ELA9359743.1 Crp/Fnr family transcriptional regulator [Vibrio parahaemolyticus]MBM4912065.1 Crp/Fnr family transcriptional regulator [Vibrio parahaemolyticus]